MTVLSKKYNTIFIHIPKTAGESVENIKDTDFCKQIAKHATAQEVQKLCKSFFNAALKFSIIRNPNDLVVSMYFHLKKPIYQSVATYNQYGTLKLRPTKAQSIALKESFPVYVKEVLGEKQIQEESLRKSWPINHFAPQLT